MSAHTPTLPGPNGKRIMAAVAADRALLALLLAALESIQKRYIDNEAFCAGCDAPFGERHGTVGGLPCLVGTAIAKARGGA